MKRMIASAVALVAIALVLPSAKALQSVSPVATASNSNSLSVQRQPINKGPSLLISFPNQRKVDSWAKSKRDGALLANNYHLDDDKDGNNNNNNNNNNSDENQQQPIKRRTRIQKFLGRLRQGLRKKLLAAIMIGVATGGFWNLATPQPADASAPVMAIPKAEQRDPATDAMMNHQRKMVQKEQAEMQAMIQKAREIEAAEGPDARAKFEMEYKAQKEKEGRAQAEGLIQLKRDLLEEGIDPFTDLEGQRQVLLYEKGLDLGKVPGTIFYLEKTLESTNYKKSSAFKHENNRRIVKAMVQDMKNRGMDPLEYFEKHKDKSMDIMKIPPLAAAQKADIYEANLEQYGQIDVPKEGEMSLKEKMEQSAEGKQNKKAKEAEAKKKEKEEQKRAKAEAKAKAAAQNKKAQEEAKAAKEAARKEKEDANAAKKAAAAAAAASTAAVSAPLSSAADAVKDSLPTSSSDGTEIVGQSSTDDAGDGLSQDGDQDDSEASAVERSTAASKPSSLSKKVNIGGKDIPVLPLAGTTIITLGGGAYGIKIVQERSAKAEEARQRQFRLLMGMDDDDDDEDETSGSPGQASALEVIDFEAERKGSPKNTQHDTAPPPPKKKRLGFFAKKNKNDRESDLNVLVSSEATAPEFAALLAKILTYGAPGRFPSVDALPGKMPLDEFHLEAAKELLTDAREKTGITLEESAEVFAGVVNCMLIDIVDLASSTLKAKDEQLTVDGISVVVDFMNHAASLYDSVAGGVVIKPVTYGGDLAKGKLEQMYVAYASSGVTDMMKMMTSNETDTNISEDFESRVALLQDVFQIPDKKAEGLMQKVTTKNMMEMMKDPEALQDMMKGLGGEEGLEGLKGLLEEGMDGTDGANINPEELKSMLQTLKGMKDSGAFSKKEFQKVQKQFKEAFGGNVDDMIRELEATAATQDEMEMLDLMKEIFVD